MKAISYPFTLDDFGRVITTSDQNKIILDRIVTLISTLGGQRPMRPTYGADMLKALYESGENETEAVEVGISQAIATWIPQVRILQINLSPTTEEGIANAEVLVSLPDATSATVSVNTAILFPDGFTING